MLQSCLLAFGLVFEMPLVITFLARLGIVNAAILSKFRKYMILIIFIGAAILTPPDVITQLFMAFPLVLLYEISIISARIFGRKKKSADEDTDTPAAPGDGSDQSASEKASAAAAADGQKKDVTPEQEEKNT